MSNKELIKMKEDFLLNLDKEDLKVYIDNIVKEYYDNYISNDNENLKNNVIELMRLPTLFEKKYPNMSNYLNYRLVVLSNRVFESIFDGRSEMYYPLEHTSIDVPNGEVVVNLLEKINEKRNELETLKKETTNLNELCDDNVIDDLLLEDMEYHTNDFINFVSNLPNVERDMKLPRALVDKVCAFMEGVKSGEYDGYLEISEDVIDGGE
ncbi:MAG: hypothetical protein IJP99_04425 [Methanobrevibacter sp.]|nr:hypothetical protein [Methanobrevibacter sp.]